MKTDAPESMTSTISRFSGLSKPCISCRSQWVGKEAPVMTNIGLSCPPWEIGGKLLVTFNLVWKNQVKWCFQEWWVLPHHYTSNRNKGRKRERKGLWCTLSGQLPNFQHRLWVCFNPDKLSPPSLHFRGTDSSPEISEIRKTLLEKANLITEAESTGHGGCWSRHKLRGIIKEKKNLHEKKNPTIRGGALTAVTN